ncbi:MAG: hypothetical protein GY851_25195 [bacterium]|nr:hypothetical protein [bacterium]
MKTYRSICALLAVVSVGLFVGWLVGVSASPVVSTVLPLVFSLLGGLGLGYAAVLSRLKAANDKIEALGKGIPANTQGAPDSEPLHVDYPSILWSVAVTVFCVACYWGIQEGIEDRIPPYPPLQKWLPEDHDLTPGEMADAHCLRLTLQAKQVDAATASNIFRDVVVALIEPPKTEDGDSFSRERSALMTEAVEKFRDGAVDRKIVPRIPAAP